MNKSKNIAFCGVFAALAVVVMCLGGFLPFMTYVCPMISILLCGFVYNFAGKTSAVCWYISVVILSLLLCPDKEAAILYSFLGYYPIIKSQIDKMRFKWLIKILFFNAIIVSLYWLLMNIIGVTELINEFSSMGTVMIAFMLLVGNFIFFMLDRLLERMSQKWK